MKNLFIVPIEKIETRYTKHWFDYLPKSIAKHTTFNVSQLALPEGDDAPTNTDGGFFNFGFTCAYKAKQLVEIEKMFDIMVKDGDVFLFTDYWNPSVFFLRYIAALKKKKITIVGICHAGIWDPNDILSKSFGKEGWGKSLEKSLHEAYDHLVFATQTSRSLYAKSYGWEQKLQVTGFPMEYYHDILPDYWNLPTRPEKENVVVFPHRKAEEKRIDYFHQIASLVGETRPDIKFVVALDVCHTKDQYHNLMYRSKVAFSAATQETLGISMGIEAPICGCIPMVPKRVSYRELFEKSPDFFYDDSTVENACERIVHFIDCFDLYEGKIKIQRNLARKWFEGYEFYAFLNTLA